MASKKNPILNLIGGLLGGVGSGNSAADKKIDLPAVVKITNKFGESMESFLDTEYEYIQYLRNRNGGGLGVGGLDGQRGAKSLIDYSRDKKRFRWGSGGIPLRRYDRSKSKVKNNRGLRGWFQDKYSRWMQHRNARKFNQGLSKKFNWDRRQIKAFRDARAKGHTWQQAQKIANNTARNRNIITRTIHGVQDWIPNRPSWMTRKEWGFLRPGVRERLGKFFSTKAANVKSGISNQLTKIKPKNFIPKNNPLSKVKIPGLSKLKGLKNMGWLTPLLAGLTFAGRKGDNQSDFQATIGTGAETLCGVGLGALGTKWGAGIGGVLGLKAFGIGAIPGAAIGGFLGGTLMGTIGAIACGFAADEATGVNDNKTNKNKFGSLVNGAAQCTDCASTSKHSGGAVINSPTRGILGGQKTLIGEAQEPELILPMSKIGDALSAVYREGASTMVGATISFLTPLSASPAVASVLGEARKLQSIVGTSDIEAETPKVPEIQQVDVKASNTETTNIEQKLNSGGFVSGPSGIDKVPARLTAGEFVMSKGAVKKFGASTLASMNAAGGGTNRPTVSGGFNEGGKVKMSEQLGHTRGVVTDKERIKQEEDYMLHWVNKERVEILGLPPLDKLSYADGVELTKEMGAGQKTTETSHTDMDFNTMTKSTWKTKTRGDETIFQGSMGVLTEEDKQAYLASNPGARMMLELKDQMELAALGADISASAKMNGGGLVQGFAGGGLVGPSQSKSSISTNIKPSPKKNFESINQSPVVQAKKAQVRSVILPVPQYIPQVVTRTIVQEVPVAKLGSLVISDQGKGVRMAS